MSWNSSDIYWSAHILKWVSHYSVCVACYSLVFLLLECGSKYSLYVEFTFYSVWNSDGI